MNTLTKTGNSADVRNQIVEWLNAPSNLIHEACGKRAPNRESVYNVHDETVYCEHCNAEFPDHTHDSYAVADKHKVIADNTNTIPMHTWYHATFVEDWGKSANKIEKGIHVGTMEASYDRILTIAGRYDTVFRLYKVTVSDDAVIRETVCSDGEVCMGECYKDNEVIPYVNGYEDTGSISLLLMPNSFTVTEEPVLLNLDDVRNTHLSEMTVTLSDAAASRKEAYGTSRPF